MRSVTLPLILAAALAAGLPAFAAENDAAPVPAPAETPAAKPAKPAKDDPNRIVCTRETVLGSNRPQKVCMTVAERNSLRDASRRFLDDQRGADAPREGGGR